MAFSKTQKSFLLALSNTHTHTYIHTQEPFGKKTNLKSIQISLVYKLKMVDLGYYKSKICDWILSSPPQKYGLGVFFLFF